MGNSLLIRADASSEIGTGHVMRTLSVAQAWQRAGGYVRYAMASATQAIVERLTRENVQIHTVSAVLGSSKDADETASLAQDIGSPWIIVDGYQFGSEYHRRLCSSGTRVLLLDDNQDSDYYYADIILNHNLHADEVDYSNRSANTRLMLGCQYALLRNEFLLSRAPKPIPNVARKILVTLGGSDPGNVTDHVLSALEAMEGLAFEAVIIVGGSSVHLEELTEHARKVGPYVQILHNVTNMPDYIAWADVGIIAGGSTYMEVAFLGLPTVVLTIAQNQEMIASRLSRDGLALSVGWFNKVPIQDLAFRIREIAEDYNMRSGMSVRLHNLVDGKGPERVVEALAEGR